MITRRTALALFAAAAAAQDWPQWRGPRRDGAAPPPKSPSWGSRLTRSWSVPVGEGHSSPVVAGSRVFQFSRQNDNEVIRAFDIETGKKLWEHAYAAPYEMNPAARAHGKGPKSTPAVAGGLVFTLGMNGLALALEAATGKVLWRVDSSRFQQSSPTFGVASSPLIDGQQALFYLGTDGDGALTSLDAQSGRIRWEWRGDGPGYGSPVAVETGGGRQFVVFSASHLVGVNAADGKLIWRLPFTTPYAQNAVTPLALGDTVIYSGLQNPVTAVRVASSGAPPKLWENKEAGMYMSSPVLCGGLVWGLSHRNKGQLFSLDPKTGKTIWMGEGRQTENAMLVAAGDLLLAMTTESELRVYRTSARGLDLVGRHAVADSPVWAHPAISADRILIKDRDALSLWRVA